MNEHEELNFFPITSWFDDFEGSLYGNSYDQRVRDDLIEHLTYLLHLANESCDLCTFLRELSTISSLNTKFVRSVFNDMDQDPRSQE